MKMKKKNSAKARLLSLTMSVMLLPVTILAQSNGFGNQTFGSSEGERLGNQMFGSSEGRSFGNQTFGSSENENIWNQTFGNQTEESPLGSGLLILVAAASGYALSKKRNDKQND